MKLKPTISEKRAVSFIGTALFTIGAMLLGRSDASDI
jgi:hypothetical protein